jgi:ATP-dependent Clp protease ATP-binding subunit ClpA
VRLVSDAIRRSRAGLSDPNRPYGSFLFLGPTGVGKTELCKALAEFLFDSQDHLIRVDMSEFMEKHSVARLIGAPPGYVGYEEGGYLTEAVRRKPYSVILLDEVEKDTVIDIAHIARIQLHYLEQRVAQMDMKLEVSDAALMELAKEGFDPVFGARPLKRAIQQRIENPLAREILAGRFAPKDIIRVDAVDGRIEFEQVIEAEAV